MSFVFPVGTRPDPIPKGDLGPITPDPAATGVTWYLLEDGSYIPGEGTYVDIVAQNIESVIICANNIDAIIAAPAAASSAAASAASATASAASATNSATAAANSASLAGASATAAQTSATNAKQSETNAAASASAANNSAQGAATSATQAANSAAAAAGSATAANNSWVTFNSMWYGPYSSTPATDPYSGAPTPGDVYFDTTTNQVMVRGNAAWQPISTGVTSVNGKTGAVTLVHTDISDWTASLAPYATLASPVFTGDPQAPTPASTDNDTSIATTAFVKTALSAAGGGVSQNYVDTADALRVLKAGDVMTGALTVPIGAQATPSLNFTGFTTTGLSCVGGTLILSCLAASKLQIGTGAITSLVQMRGIDGTAAAPSYSFSNSNDAGLYRSAANVMGMAASGANVMTWAGATKITTAFGPVVLPTDPVNPLEAATKQYVDLKAPLDSPVFTGDPRAPTPSPADNDTSIATTAFVKTAIGGVQGGAIIAPTPPAFVAGSIWYDSTGGQTYIAYDDGNSQQYVTASNFTGLANAATKSDVGSALNNVGRNLIHNGLFTVAQRGAGPFATFAAYTLDRWLLGGNTDTASIAQGTMADAARTAIGDEEATYNLGNINFVGNGAAGAFSSLVQPIENVRRLAGKTVIVSFWATCAAGALKLGVSLDQVFGTGGSPSPIATGTGQAVTLSTTWTRYSVTLAIPVISGIKTVGTNPDHCNQLRLWYSSGATNAARAGNVGVQSGTILLWGVQLEIAAPGQTAPTPLEKRDPVLELQQCQRFYCTGSFNLSGYIAATGTGYNYVQPFPVTMRGPVTITPSGTTAVNVTGNNLSANSAGFSVFTNGAAVGGFIWSGTFTASADL
jgi:hypothetical protein